MTVTETTNETPAQADDVAESPVHEHTVDEAAADVVDEVLVEEISIDGMCGVY